MAIKTLGLLTMLAFSTGCSAGSVRPDDHQAQLVLSRLRNKYAVAQHYEDEGTATSADERGQDTVRFATSMDRKGELRLRFGAAREPETRHQLTHSAAGTFVDSFDEHKRAESLIDATWTLAGISRRSSVVVPSLLYGIDFCECLTGSTVTFGESRNEPSVVVLRVQLQQDKRIEFVVQERDLILKEIRFISPDIFGATKPYNRIMFERIVVE